VKRLHGKPTAFRLTSVLAGALPADGFAVSITAPNGRLYPADQFNLLLTNKSLNPQGAADDG
jgi:hypothetical protein